MLAGLSLADYEFQVPLDYSRPNDGSLRLFVRQVAAMDKAQEAQPYLLFLQGVARCGPGLVPAAASLAGRGTALFM